MNPMHEVPGSALPGPAIETSGLTKCYGKVSALTDCTISVPEGRITALIGPNGAGKTTLLRVLAGLSRPTAGQAMVNGPPRARIRPSWPAIPASWPRTSRCTAHCRPRITSTWART